MEALLFDPAREILEKIISFVWLSLVALVVIIIGWLLSKAIHNLVLNILKVIRLDKLSEKAGIAKFLSKGGIKYSLAELISVIIYWLLMLVVIMVTANLLGLDTVAQLMDKVVQYIPNVLTALIVMFFGALLAVFVRNIVETTAKNAGLTHAKSMGMLTHTVIIIFSVMIALEQLRIGTTVISQVVSIVFGSVGLAIALAFGLGCRDIAAEAMRNFLEKHKAKHN